MVRLSFISLIVFFSASCTTTSNDISLKKMKPEQRVYVARLKVDFNGNRQPKCEVYFNLDVTPSIRLSDDGYLFYKTDRENLKLKKMACFHSATNNRTAWHFKNLPLSAVEKSADALEVTYFGDIEFNWKIDPQLTIQAAEKDQGNGYHIKEGRVDNSGEITSVVTDQHVEAEKVFFSRLTEAKDKGLQFKTRLVQIKYE